MFDEHLGLQLQQLPVSREHPEQLRDFLLWTISLLCQGIRRVHDTTETVYEKQEYDDVQAAHAG